MCSSYTFLWKQIEDIGNNAYFHKINLECLYTCTHRTILNKPKHSILLSTQVYYSYLPFLKQAIFAQQEYEILKFGTDTDKYGNLFSNYQRTYQLFSLSSYVT